MQSQDMKRGSKVGKPDLAKEKKGLTVTLYVGGNRVEILTAEQCESIAKRMGDSMSIYYTAHPEEYQKI